MRMCIEFVFWSWRWPVGKRSVSPSHEPEQVGPRSPLRAANVAGVPYVPRRRAEDCAPYPRLRRSFGVTEQLRALGGAEGDVGFGVEGQLVAVEFQGEGGVEGRFVGAELDDAGVVMR